MADKDTIIATLGRGTYVVEASLEFGNIACHVLIGNYSSIAHDVKFVAGLDHPLGNLYTGVLELLGKNNKQVYREIKEKNCKWFGDKDQIIIGNDVWIGRGVTIMGGVKVGNGAVIGAGAVVAKDIPAYAVAVGNPARVIKYRFDEYIINDLQKIKWWYWPENKLKLVMKYKNDVCTFINKYRQEVSSIKGIDSVEQVVQLKKNGYTIYYFVCEETDGISEVTIHVINQYLKSFTIKDKVALIIETFKEKNSKFIDAEIDGIIESYHDRESIPLIIMNIKEIDEKDISLAIISKGDYLIMTKDYRLLKYWDYSTDFGAGFLYGLSEHIFKK